MGSATALITFMVIALFYVLTDAAPPSSGLHRTLPHNFTATDAGVSMVSKINLDDPNGLSHVPDLNSDIWHNKNRCYYWYGSERWEDVGGEHSQFVNDSVYGMCEFITTYTTSAGFEKDATISICKDIDRNTQVNGNHHTLRSIGMMVTYRGASNAREDLFIGFDAHYCFDILSAALDCGAGGEFIMANGDTPRYFFEAKGDPNLGDCAEHGYDLIL